VTRTGDLRVPAKTLNGLRASGFGLRAWQADLKVGLYEDSRWRAPGCGPLVFDSRASAYSHTIGFRVAAESHGRQPESLPIDVHENVR
jgi:hypothetical protein